MVYIESVIYRQVGCCLFTALFQCYFGDLLLVWSCDSYSILSKSFLIIYQSAGEDIDTALSTSEYHLTDIIQDSDSNIAFRTIQHHASSV
jgi:hypothetical protein